MKKIKNQLGLVKPDKLPAGATAKSEQKPATRKASKPPKKRKQGGKGRPFQPKPPKKRKQGGKGRPFQPKPPKKRKQGGKGRPFQPKPWEAYAPKGPNATSYTREELEQIVRRASGAANRRLKRLEEAGETKGVYKRALGMLETQGRTKFSGAVKSMTRTELVAEYLRLRDFLSSKTSTMQGIKDWKRNVYESLVDRGFTGSQEELSELFDKYMTKELEAALGSDVVYTLLQTENGRPFLQRAKDAIDRAKQTGESQTTALSREFNITTEEQAAQILAKYFGG
jgi:hypothetical protein